MNTGRGVKRVRNTIHRLVAKRDESGQALAIVVIVIVLLVGFSVSLANQSNQQAPIAEQSVLARLAMQAAQVGLADYQDFISANPENASSFCSYTTFTSCTSQSTTVASGSNGVSLPSTTVDVASTSGFSTSAIISVTSSTAAQQHSSTISDLHRDLHLPNGVHGVHRGNRHAQHRLHRHAERAPRRDRPCVPERIHDELVVLRQHGVERMGDRDTDESRQSECCLPVPGEFLLPGGERQRG
jgi:Tfp pilus assembly protein PilX